MCVFTISLQRNQKQNIFQFKTYNIMKALNNTQKLFTTGQLVGIIFITAVVITLAALWLTSNFSAFGGSY